jgi:hypothetical protein
VSLHAGPDAKSFRAIVLSLTFSIKGPCLKYRINIFFIIDTPVVREWDGSQNTQEVGNIEDVLAGI